MLFRTPRFFRGHLPLRDDVPLFDPTSSRALQLLLFIQIGLFLIGLVVGILHVTPLPEDLQRIAKAVQRTRADTIASWLFLGFLSLGVLGLFLQRVWAAELYIFAEVFDTGRSFFNSTPEITTASVTAVSGLMSTTSGAILLFLALALRRAYTQQKNASDAAATAKSP